MWARYQFISILGGKLACECSQLFFIASIFFNKFHLLGYLNCFHKVLVLLTPLGFLSICFGVRLFFLFWNSNHLWSLRNLLLFGNLTILYCLDKFIEILIYSLFWDIEFRSVFIRDRTWLFMLLDPVFIEFPPTNTTLHPIILLRFGHIQSLQRLNRICLVTAHLLLYNFCFAIASNCLVNFFLVFKLCISLIIERCWFFPQSFAFFFGNFLVQNPTVLEI